MPSIFLWYLYLNLYDYLYSKTLGVVNSIKVKFPRHDLFSPPMQWNTDVRRDMLKQLGRRCMELGIEITKKSQPICREDLMKINTELLNLNTPDALARRAIFVAAFLSVGRSGEVAISEWKTSYWCSELEQHCFVWNRLKTVRQNIMGNVSDGQRCFEIDSLHSTASYMLLGGTSRYFVGMGQCSRTGLVFEKYCKYYSW